MSACQWKDRIDILFIAIKLKPVGHKHCAMKMYCCEIKILGIRSSLKE
jgi:hypothetical protein